MTIFPSEPGLSSFIAAKDDGSGDDNWSYRHHQPTNTQLFTGWMPFLSPNQQCQSTPYSTDLFAPGSPVGKFTGKF